MIIWFAVSSISESSNKRKKEQKIIEFWTVKWIKREDSIKNSWANQAHERFLSIFIISAFGSLVGKIRRRPIQNSSRLPPKCHLFVKFFSLLILAVLICILNEMILLFLWILFAIDWNSAKESECLWIFFSLSIYLLEYWIVYFIDWFF